MRLPFPLIGVAYHNRDTISFWVDSIDGRINANLYPSLFGYTKDRNASLKAILATESIFDCFKIPMSRQAYNDTTGKPDVAVCL